MKKSHQSPQDELWSRHSVIATTFYWSEQVVRGGQIREEDKQGPPLDGCSSMLTLGRRCLWPQWEADCQPQPPHRQPFFQALGSIPRSHFWGPTRAIWAPTTRGRTCVWSYLALLLNNKFFMLCAQLLKKFSCFLKGRHHFLLLPGATSPELA